MITRCAIYTRKSSEEGLDMAFNSLDAQREAGVDFIKSQKHQGWVAIETRYDDGGYSGGSTERPGLQHLLSDIVRGRVDAVLVYKVDRLSRSLADFARLMQVFDEHKVSFVSVTQQFNTTTSMGRLTLNMLLSFAQFEREVAGERIRDKIAATKRRGVWVCGQPPLGYRLEGTGEQRGLRVVPEQAALVRAIYLGYLKSGSLVSLAADLRKQGFTTKRWQSSRGLWHGGKPLTTSNLYLTLNNPVYSGRIAHTRAGKTAVYPGRHEAIIDRALWDRVQARMAEGSKERKHAWAHTHLLAGKVRTSEGHAMSPSSVQRPRSKHDPKGPKHLVRYYVSQKAIKQGYRSCPVRSVNARALDDLVRGVVRSRLRCHGEAGDGSGAVDLDARIREVLESVTVSPGKVVVSLDLARLTQTRGAANHEPPHENARVADSFTAVDAIPFEMQRTGERELLTVRVNLKALPRRRLLIGPESRLQDPSDAIDMPDAEHLPHAVGMAYAWLREILADGCTVEEIAKRYRCSPAHVHKYLRLTRLGPAILRHALGPNSTSLPGTADAFALTSTLWWRQQATRLKGAS